MESSQTDSIVFALARADSLSELPQCVLRQISRVVTTQRFERGDQVLSHQDASRDLYVILAGKLRVNMVGTSGRALTFQVLPQGEMFGEVAAVDGLPRSASVVAETDAVLAKVDEKAFAGLIADSPEFAQVILRRLARLSRRLTERLFEYHAYDVRGRVYAELLRATAAEPEAPVTMTDRDMASRVGTTRENVSRIVARLRKDGIVERHQSSVKVHERAQLRTLLAQCEFG